MQMNWAACSLDKNIPQLTCIPQLITVLIFWLISFAGIVAIFLLIFGGIKFINSGGDQKSVDSARKTITYTLIGLFLIFISFALVTLLGTITGTKNLLDFHF